MDFMRARREKRFVPVINDPQPLASADDVWGSAAQMATVGIFILILIACLYFARPILLPVMAAAPDRHDVRADHKAGADGPASRPG